MPAARHPNRLHFGGVLSRIGLPSDGSPGGDRGHRVLLTAAAVQEAIPSLEGMAVSFAVSWDKHNCRQKCGIITHAEVMGDELRVIGYLYDRDFPEVADEIRKGNMGMSWEICDASVAEMNDDPWVLTHVTFTGAAILKRNKAAYRTTHIRLVE